ncbi:excalibur calcium-binding domain-containing protein [Streptomyces cyaneofuscatus]
MKPSPRWGRPPRGRRAGGARPPRRGRPDPGYASHLDRDGDGVGCE